MPVRPGRPRPRLVLGDPCTNSILVDHLLEDEPSDLLQEGSEGLRVGEVDLGCLRQPQAPTPPPPAVVLDVPLPVRWEVPTSVPDLRCPKGIQALKPQLDGVRPPNSRPHVH